MSIKWNALKTNTRSVTAKHHDFEFEVKYKTEFATQDNLEKIDSLFKNADSEKTGDVSETFISLVTQLTLLVDYLDIEGDKSDGFPLDENGRIKPTEKFFLTWSLPLLGVVIKAIYDDMYAPLETASTTSSDG